MGSSKRYSAPALEKGLEILELLAGKSGSLSLSEISDGVGRSKSEIFRMLQVLEERRYLERTPENDGYALTNRLFLLGMEKPPNKGLLEVALPVMHELADEITHPCHLVVPSGEFIVVIARVDSPGDLGLVVRVGHRRPLIHSTSGLVLFAFQREAEQERWLTLASASGGRFSGRQFQKKVRLIRVQGYAISPSTLVPGVVDLSAPVLQHKIAIAALTVPYLDRHPHTLDPEQAVQHVRRAADRISNSLGHGTGVGDTVP